MPRINIGTDVFTEAIDRMRVLYREGHRVVVSFSAGKDSGVCMEICRIANQLEKTGEPVDVVIRDEEIMLPGTYEYAERVAEYPDVRMHWLVAQQPVINVFNREAPYFWVMDPRLDPDEWVRKPPPYAEFIPEKNIGDMINRDRFPVADDKDLIVVIGLRVEESPNRNMGIQSSGGYLCKRYKGKRKCRPIYDWKTSDVWKAILDNQWDYNKAYDVMVRHSVNKSAMRIGPPTMSAAGLSDLQLMYKAWPKFFDRVCDRLPGIRTAAIFGRSAVEPHRKLGDSWQETFKRECIDEAPDWIAERSIEVLRKIDHMHRRKGVSIPEIKSLNIGEPMIASWKKMTRIMYNGDPFCLKQDILNYVEPEFFRDGAGTWGGKPTW